MTLVGCADNKSSSTCSGLSEFGDGHMINALVIADFLYEAFDSRTLRCHQPRTAHHDGFENTSIEAISMGSHTSYEIDW
jgi:hypothetical protein